MTSGLDIDGLLNAAKAKLLADSYFATRVSVNTENDGDIAKMVTNALNKLTVHVELGDVIGTDKRPNVPSPAWFPINFTAVVTELVVTNRATAGYKTSQLVANQCAEVLKGQLSGTVDEVTTQYGYVATKSIRRIYKDKTYLIHEVEFQIGE